ncbi:MAG: ATP-binding protein, partial [Chloroflexi bacterium]|nr:ATP-binding protein [Chloroflexota bacterium]
TFDSHLYTQDPVGTITRINRNGSLDTFEWEAALSWFLTPEVLVIDEVGHLRYGSYAANALSPVVDQRYQRGNRPMLLTTNKDPRTEWRAVLHDADLSAAILDRLLHRGESMKVEVRSHRQHRPG